ncbi:MAG TPA: hypothetical protein VGE98_10135, partial [Thermoanaerobaculia bacterium]
GSLKPALEAAQPAFAAPKAAAGADPRALTGVHFFMFYGLAADTQPVPALPVPTFQTAAGKDLLVGLSLYDANFGPYIDAFTSQPPIAAALDALLTTLDESGIVEPTNKTSAAFILKRGGVAKNSSAFRTLLMRYNFGDPTIPAAAKFPVNTPPQPKYLLGATFPGLTVGSILQSYPNAQELWPWPPVAITFEPAAKP